MLNEQQVIKKPMPCNQKWEDMLPSERGRICLGCGKHVTDFREYSWAEITKVHNSSPIPVCGIYSDEQINSWGQKISKHQSWSSKLVTISAAFLSLTQFSPSMLNAQKAIPQEQTQTINLQEKQTPLVAKPKQKFISGTVVVLQADSSMLPLKGVLIYVLQDSLNLKTTTDSLGRFSIDITSSFNKLSNKMNLIVSHPDYLIQPITLDKNILSPLDIILSQVTVKSHRVNHIANGTAFYAVVKTNPSSDEDTLKNKKKKWWQFWKRKKNENN